MIQPTRIHSKMGPQALLVIMLMVVSMVLRASTGVLALEDDPSVIELDENVGWYKHYSFLVHLTRSASSLVRVLDIMPRDVVNPSSLEALQQLDAHTLETATLFVTVREFDLYFPPCGIYSRLVEEQRALVEQHVRNLINQPVKRKRGALKVALAEQVGHYVRSLAIGMFSKMVEDIASFQQGWEDFAKGAEKNPLLSSGRLEPNVPFLTSDALQAKINEREGGKHGQKYVYEGAFQKMVTVRTHAFAHMLTGLANVVWKDLETLKALHAQEERAIYTHPNNTAKLWSHARSILHRIEQVTGPSATSHASFLELQSRADAISVQLLKHLTMTTTNEGLPEVSEESDRTSQTKSSTETDPIPPSTHSRKARSVEGQRMKPKMIMRLRDLA